MLTDKQININDYDYNLSEDRIAKYPVDLRDMSKLLIKDNSRIAQSLFRNVSNYLPKDSLIVFNNTKVIKARLHFAKESGSQIEIFCLEPLNPIDYSLSLSAIQSCTWKCLIGNNKKWKTGKLSQKIAIKGKDLILSAERMSSLGNAYEVVFSWENPKIFFADILENAGNIPIPPYLNRNAEDVDTTRYQTIYSKHQGSVAAPTAGLHFTETVFSDITKKNIKTDNITLHVGAGTFQPVKSELVSEHEMHTEHFLITFENIENLKRFYGNITVVGTTTVRTLESFFQIAVQLLKNPNKKDNNFIVSQWEAYENQVKQYDVIELTKNTLSWMTKNKFSFLNCSTSIMIIPGYKFWFTNRLITNFHQPKSTLLLLLAAFASESWRDCYKYAVENNFRFLSYGDSCLFCPTQSIINNFNNIDKKI